MPEPNLSFIQKSHNVIGIARNPMVGWLILFLSLSLTLAAYLVASKQVQLQANEHFMFLSQDIGDLIKKRLVIYEQALHGGVGLFNASNSVSRDEWRRYVASLALSEALPGIQGIGFAQPILPSQLTIHEEQIRNEGFPDYRVWPDSVRSEYTSIVYLEPFDWRNQRAFGYDMWSNDVRRAAMERARDTASPATSASVILVQEKDKDVQNGFLTYLPVYSKIPVPDSLAERHQYFIGWVYAAFRINDLMEGILGDYDGVISFQIYDGENVTPDALIYNSRNDTSLPNKGYENIFDRMVLQRQPWQIVYNIKQSDMVLADEARKPFYVLIFGVIINLFLLYIINSLHFINQHTQKTSKLLRVEYDESIKKLTSQSHLIKEKEIEAQTFFDLAPDAFLMVDQQGVIVRANKQAHVVFGYQIGELYGNKIEMLIPDTHSKGHSDKRSKYSKNPTTRMMSAGDALPALRRNGDIFYANINLVAMNFSGEKHIVATVHDVSLQKTIEKNLSDAKAKAESTSRAKSDFIANMSHEIRTPLNAVLGSAQLLERTDPSVKQKKYIHMIRNSGETLLAVINDILDLSKIESGKMELDESTFNLDVLLQRVALMMSVTVGEKPLVLVIHVDEHVPRKLKGDALRLQQVLINLISNAIKFTRFGCVILRIDALIAKSPNECRLHFAVIDSGIGMTKDQQKSIFDAFTQADTSITRRFGGTGLGLIISNQIINLMSSNIVVNSEKQKGSTFSFTVNIALSGDETPVLLSEKKYTVLLIEESSAVTQSIKHVLRRWNWHMLNCSSIDDLKGFADNYQINFSEIDFCIVSSESIGASSSSLLNKLSELKFPKTSPVVLSFLNTFQATSIPEKIENQFDARLIKPITSFGLLEALNDGAIKCGHTPLVVSDSPLVNTEYQLSGVRILLVEDNLLNQQIAEDFLADTGVILSMVDNGLEAVNVLREQLGNFDIVLMDIQMPVMDGVSATHIIRHELGSKIPIIAMTAGVLQSEKQHYLDAEMNNLIPKPIDGIQLMEMLKQYAPTDCRIKDVVINDSGMKGKNTNIEKNIERNYDVVEVESSHHEGKSEGESLLRNFPEESLMVFNGARLDSITKGKVVRIKRICDALESMNVTLMKEIDTGYIALQQGKKDDALSIFHGLKGVCANYGAQRVNATVEALEGCIREDMSLPELEAAIINTRTDVQEFLLEAITWCRAQSVSLDGNLDEK